MLDNRTGSKRVYSWKFEVFLPKGKNTVQRNIKYLGLKVQNKGTFKDCLIFFFCLSENFHIYHSVH